MSNTWEYDSRFLLSTWIMHMCYDVDYINTTIARAESMIEMYNTLLK
jgi:hypothetical protein